MFIRLCLHATFASVKINSDESMNFNQIVTVAAPEYGRLPETRLCPDQYVGRLSEVLNHLDFPFRVAASERPDSPCLIMVMESPHRDEFIGIPGPAKGKTGELIRQHLGVAIDCTELQDMGLILMNPIQHQCSLGERDTALYRDKIFRAIWANGGREEFTVRLLATFKPGDTLMNCCTLSSSGATGMPLRHLVESAIRAALPEVDSIKRTHPASWKYAGNCGKTWYY